MAQAVAAIKPGAPGLGRAYLDSLDFLRSQINTEAKCRTFLEAALWPQGRFCPHCGSLSSTLLRGESTRPGLYQCRDCRLQFTVTTKTPLHGTKLPLWRWIQAMWLMLSSSKGLSSVILGRLVGLPQKTAWKLMHGVRELMALYEAAAPKLRALVEIDTAFVGGKPRAYPDVKYAAGRGTTNPAIVIASDARGFVRAAPIEREAADPLQAFAARWIDPGAHLVGDSSTALEKLGAGFAGITQLNHKAKEFSKGGLHGNTVEGFAGKIERTRIGVYHQMSRAHLNRYVAEAVCRWNACDEEEGEEGDPTGRFVQRNAIPLLSEIFGYASGMELRRSRVGGIKSPGGPEPEPRRLQYRLARRRKAGQAGLPDQSGADPALLYKPRKPAIKRGRRPGWPRLLAQLRPRLSP